MNVTSEPIPMDVSVIIPSYNTQATIEKTLTSLENQENKCEFEIILVDCSPHDQVEKIAKRFERVNYIHASERFNPGEGRNIGSHQARGQLLIFIDADVLLDSHAVQEAWKCYQRGSRIFGGALELNRETSIGISSWLEHMFFNHESQARRPACKRNNLSSALMCMDRKIFSDAGGFKDIPRMQDTELTERLRSQAFELEFFPQIIGFQTQDSPLSKVLRKIYINGQNLYYIRYQGRMTTFRKIGVFALLPIMGAAKILRIIARHLRYQPWQVKTMTIVLAFPLTVAGLYWIGGLYQALVSGEGISANRD